MKSAIALGMIVLTAGLAAGPAPKLRVCLVSGSDEYESDRTLAAYQKYLEARYPVDCTLIKATRVDDLPGLEALDDCDVALFFTRRLTIKGDQLDRVKRYAESGRPIVAVRTASHGFQNWLDFDKLILGGSYHGHYSNDKSTRAHVVSEVADHPILQGVRGIATRGSLYKASPLADDTHVLMIGTSPEGKEPVAWTRQHREGRVFYTSLGAQGDFENATFLRFLTNALFWAARRDVPIAEVADAPPLRPRREGSLRLKLRTRVEPFKGSGDRAAVTLDREFPVAETAIIICDMWDRHWCRGATERCDALASKMAPVLRAARAAGIQIVHAPSECMDFYAGTPQRLRAQLAPPVTPPKPIALPPEPPLPIDDSDGGCDTDDAFYLAWTRENPKLDVGEFDAISDNGNEIYNLLQQLGIKNVLMVGVHTNMCVLGRSFAIREMARRGMRCVLVRDLTDAMYDPKDRPHVPHDAGTSLVVEHIETYLCPSTTAREVVEGLPEGAGR